MNTKQQIQTSTLWVLILLWSTIKILMPWTILQNTVNGIGLYWSHLTMRCHEWPVIKSYGKGYGLRFELLGFQGLILRLEEGTGSEMKKRHLDNLNKMTVGQPVYFSKELYFNTEINTFIQKGQLNWWKIKTFLIMQIFQINAVLSNFILIKLSRFHKNIKQ